MRRVILWLFFGLAVAAIVALSATSGQLGSIRLFGHTMISLGALVLVGAVLGSVAVASLLSARGQSSTDEALRLTKWQAEDTKLVAQIKSDREKQLEAKIATLEAALKSSLKKS